MPIHTMNFEAGVFYARQVGYVDNVDARMWANALGKYARQNDFPIMAIVDMTEVDRLCPTVTKVIEKILADGNLIGVALITSDMMASRNANVIGKLGAMRGIRMFNTFDAAHTFVTTNVSPTLGGGLAYTMQTVAVAV